MREDHPLWVALAGMAGAALTAAYVALAALNAPAPLNDAARARLAAESVIAVLAGGATAYWLGPVAAEAAHVSHPSGDSAAGFVLGMLCWRLLPAGLRLAEQWLANLGPPTKPPPAPPPPSDK